MASAPVSDLTPEENENVRGAVRSLIEAVGSQRGAAARLGLTPSAISGFMSGKTGTSFGVARRVADAFSMDVMELLGLYAKPSRSASDWIELLWMAQDAAGRLGPDDIYLAREFAMTAWSTMLVFDPMMAAFIRWRDSPKDAGLETLRLKELIEAVWTFAPVDLETKKLIRESESLALEELYERKEDADKPLKRAAKKKTSGAKKPKP